MIKLKVKEMAEIINKEGRDYNWLAVVRLLRETAGLWKNPEHKDYLSKDCKVLLENDPKI